jgi:hypothetical protein
MAMRNHDFTSIHSVSGSRKRQYGCGLLSTPWISSDRQRALDFIFAFGYSASSNR